MKKLVSFPLALLSMGLLAGCSHIANPAVPSTPPVTVVPHDTATDGAMMAHKDVTTEEEFIVRMIPHHQEAVDTSMIIVAKTENKELKAIAQGIIDAQKKEITELNGWLKSWYPTSTLATEHNTMMRDLTKLSGHELDDAYMEDMVKHHEWAIDMAQEVLEVSQRSEIVTLAKNIIASQTSEIETFKKMLNDH